MAKHYIMTDESGRILRGFSDDFEQPEAGAICICEDGSRHFELNGVINPPMTDYNGVALYKFVNGYGENRTAEEIAADIAAIPAPAPEPTPQEQTDALMLDHEERLIYLELGVNE